MNPLHDSIISLTKLTRLMWILNDDEYEAILSIAKQQSDLAKNISNTFDMDEKNKMVQETLTLRNKLDQLLKQYQKKYGRDD